MNISKRFLDLANKYVWDNIFLTQDRAHLRMIQRGIDFFLTLS